MQIKPIHLVMACAVSALATPALAQTGTVSLGDGTVIHGDGSGKATVRVNGQVINAASGEGAVAETHIGSRSSTVKSADQLPPRSRNRVRLTRRQRLSLPPSTHCSPA